MRKLGVDYGDARIGLALSDPLGIIASNLETLKSTNLAADAAAILKIATDKQADTIVIGLPLNMDGTSGPRALKSKELGAHLEANCKLKIAFIDERLTTVQSEKLLIEAGTRRDKRKEVIDQVAATIILQSYLNKKI